MTEYHHPGVYIQEIETGPRPIEGVPTSTAAFLGETERGPLTPRLITSYSEYKRLFGGVFHPTKYMPHAINGFFDNGGKRAVVCRVEGNGAASPSVAGCEDALASLENPTGVDAPAVRAISLVYAPNAAAHVAKAVVAHCEKMRHRFAVIDCEQGRSAAADLQPFASIAGSSYGAFYYPWIVTAEPGSGARTLTPPGGHVLGIYARSDIERGVFKAPSNEVVRGALDVEFNVTEAMQDVLNPKGVNVIRRFAGGIRVWGARTMASNAEWKYVHVRRLFIFLERSIDEGMQWAVFEPNGERLWARVTDTIRQFLRAQWRAGALQGQTEQDAFFVRCDRTTMTHDDIDNGRLICLVGVATIRPAEFVIFRILQRTAEHSP
jgi:phage tail sheath protein FI